MALFAWLTATLFPSHFALLSPLRRQLSDEQLYQLHEFMTATKELYNPTAPGPPDAPEPQAQPYPSEPQQASDEPATASASSAEATGEGEKVLRDILDSSSRAEKK